MDFGSVTAVFLSHPHPNPQYCSGEDRALQRYRSEYVVFPSVIMNPLFLDSFLFFAMQIVEVDMIMNDKVTDTLFN